MLDIAAHAKRNGSPGVSIIPNIEFLRIELSPLQSGDMFVCLTATTVDEEEAQLLDQEIATERVKTLDDALALIKAHVLFAPTQHGHGPLS